jgi:hypothetical protein
VAEDDEVVAPLTSFEKNVTRDDRVAEKPAYVHDLREALLMLEGHGHDRCSSGRCQIDGTVAHVTQVRSASLKLVGAIEIVSADDDACVVAGNRKAVGVVTLGSIGPPGDLVVNDPLSTAVAVRVDGAFDGGATFVGRREMDACPVAVGECRRRASSRDHARCDSHRGHGGARLRRPCCPASDDTRGRQGENDAKTMERATDVVRLSGPIGGAPHMRNHGHTKRRGSATFRIPRSALQCAVAVPAAGGYPVPSMTTQGDIEATLQALFNAERAVREAHDDLVEADSAQLLPLLERAAREALKLDDVDEDEASLRLSRIAAILGELQGARVVDLLIDILGSDEPEARRAAGEAIAELTFDRFKEVALGVERALDRLPDESPALAELPYLLAEVPEPGATKLLGRFLQHRNADAVAAAIEAIVEVGDPAALPLLAPLAGDTRQVQLEDEGGTEGEATIGELVEEARSILAKGRPA